MPFSVVLTIQDRKGKQSTTEFHLADGLTIAQLVPAAQAIAQLVAPLIKGSIVSIGVGLKVALPIFGDGDGNLISDDSDVEEGARFQWVTDTGFPTAQRLPTFNEDFIVVGTDEVDRTNPFVQAFIDAVEGQLSVASGGGTFNTTLRDSRGDSIQRLNYARESFISSRRNRR